MFHKVGMGNSRKLRLADADETGYNTLVSYKLTIARAIASQLKNIYSDGMTSKDIQHFFDEKSISFCLIDEIKACCGPFFIY